MSEVKTPSGAIANVMEAGFIEAMKLNNAVLSAFAQHGLKEMDIVKALTSARDGSILDNTVDLNALLMGVAGVIANENVHAALWPCLAKCTYEREKITLATFEPANKRGDFYSVALECVKVNLLPFWVGHLSSLLGTSKVTTTTTLE